MDQQQIEYEKARAYWWQIYCKCRQIQKNFEKKTGKDKEDLITEMESLSSPCGTAKEAIKELLWSYIKKESQYEVKLPGPMNAKSPGIKINSVWLWAYFAYHLLDSRVFSLYRSYIREQKEFTQMKNWNFITGLVHSICNY